MNASAGERSKASRIRSKGARASAADRAWLARYDERDKKRKPAKRDERPASSIRRARERAQKSPGSSEESRSSQVPAEPARLPTNLPADGPPSASGAAAAPPVSPFPEAPPVASVEAPSPPEPWVRIDATPEPATSAPGVHASAASGDAPLAAQRCPCGPDCQGCRNAVGGLVCVTTGKRQWPRMTQQGARGISSALLFAIGQAIRLFRPDRRLIPPTRDEVDMFAEALTEVAYRRASWASRWDDLSALAFAFGRYAMRASSEPDQKAPTDELAALRARIAELEEMRKAA